MVSLKTSAVLLAVLLETSVFAKAGLPVESGVNANGTDNVPQVFAPGVISSASHDSAPAFTPDGKTVFFTRSNNSISIILESRLVGGNWSTPVVVAFSGHWNDMEPSMSPDGKFLVFVSSRPSSPGGQPVDGHFNGKTQPGKGGNLWRVDRTAAGWGEPVHLSANVNRSTSTFAPSVVADGSLYFMDNDPGTGRFRIYRSQFEAGQFQPAKPADFSDGVHGDVDPAVAPDESYAVFASSRPPAKGMDLFIAFHKDGIWSTPQHMGDTINSPGSDAEARFSPDGKTLYFSSERILPVKQPLTSKEAEEAVRDMEWNNGLYNIWWVSLVPWLDHMNQ